jgi:hypothetical protein
VAAPATASTGGQCLEPYRDLIELAVAHGRNAVAIWRDLVDDHGFPAQYASVHRFLGRLRGPQTAEAHPIIVTAPGEEGQVDYGDGPMVRHPVTGKYRRARLFVFTLERIPERGRPVPVIVPGRGCRRGAVEELIDTKEMGALALRGLPKPVPTFNLARLRA